MKHGSTISLQSQIGSELSGQQQVKAAQSDQKCKHQQAWLWFPYFGIHKVFCSSITLTKEKTINSKYHITLFLHLKEEIIKKQPQMKKRMLFYQDCVTSQSQQWQNTWIALRIASVPTLFSRSGPQQLVAVCRPQKNVRGKEIWLQWRSDIGNWGIFWGQRQIVL